MRQPLRSAYEQELERAERAQSALDFGTAVAHLERAHILGQRYLIPHFRTHWRMFVVARQRRDADEMRGQALRLFAVVPGYLFGWVPKGNTGGANVSALKPMPPPADLAPLVADHNVARDVAGRLFLWVLAVAAGVSILFTSRG